MTRLLRILTNFAFTLLIVTLLLPAFSAPRFPTQKQAPQDEKHRIDKTLDACMEKNDSTHGMLTCLRTAREMWDGELNAIYKKLLAKLPAKGQAELKASQRAWVVFRDREYKAINSLFARLEGTMYLPMHAEAGMRLTKERALQLGSLLDIYNTAGQ